MTMKIKQLFLVAILLASVFSASAQLNSVSLYNDISRSIPNERIVIPYDLDVTYDKTVHIIFPSQIRYVDLGSNNIIAGKADDAENVLRVKADIRYFESNTNLAVICDDGSFYSFNVKYMDEPERLNIEMQDFLNPRRYQAKGEFDGSIYFQELGNESPTLVKLIMKTIWQNNKQEIKHIGSKKFRTQFHLRGLYTHNGLLYFHTLIKNQNQIPYNIDFITFKIVDKKVAKRTAIQEQILQPLRTYNDVIRVGGNHTQRSVFVMNQFSLPDDKVLEVTLFEQNGGRHLTFILENEDIVRAKNIENLKLKI